MQLDRNDKEGRNGKVEMVYGMFKMCLRGDSMLAIGCYVLPNVENVPRIFKNIYRDF